MKKSVFISIILSVTLAMTGCASTSGNAALADKTAMEKIREGKSTIADVRAILGEPAQARTADNGDKIYTYYYSSSTIYPIMGMNTTDTDTATIRFNKSGVVTAKDLGKQKARF